MTRRSADGRGAVRGGFSLTGCHAAQRVLQLAGVDPLIGPVQIGVVGPSGTGKTALLDGLARIYADAGVLVDRCVAGPSAAAVLPDVPAPEVPMARALIVDDAQWLADGALEELCRLAAQAGGVRLVVAHRPWPRPRGLAALDTLLGRDRPLVVLGVLDRAAVAERATELLGTAPQPSLLDVLHGWTGGLPSLVDALAAGLIDEGLVSSGALRGVPRMPAAVVEVVRARLEQLESVPRALLAAVDLDAPLDADLLARLLDVHPAEVPAAVEAAQAAALMGADGRLVLMVRHAVARLTPLLTRRRLQERLAELLVERGGSVLAAGRHLLGAGATGARAARLLEAAGEEALRESPTLARSLLDQAVRAGANAPSLAARRAEAAASAGDLDGALRLADQAIAGEAASERTRGLRVAAAVLAHRGLLARSAALYRSLGEQPDSPDRGSALLLAVPGLVGTGSLKEAEAALHSGEPKTARPLSLLADAVALTAQGVYDSVAGSTIAALSSLVQASSLLESAHRLLLPDTPAAFAAVVAHHSGDFDLADSVLERAIAAAVGEPLTTARHRLLQAWTALRRGNSALARSLLDLTGQEDARLEARDELFAVAVEAGIARRQGDLDLLMNSWRRAREALMRHPVDLFVLQPLGELANVAVRLGERRWIQPFLDDAWALLERLGDPPLWASWMHWYGLAAAVTEEDVAAARQHAAALSEAGKTSGFADVMAAAARGWLWILTGNVDAARIEATARRLQAVGMAWDAARLAGQAAIRAREPATMRALLGLARAAQAAATSGAVEANDEGVLSEREREVASFVLAGLTYKEIGAQLFISSKTVEHHVARIRQRLGAGTRAELLAKLRALLAEPEP